MAPPYRPVVDGLVIPDTPEKLAVHGHINGHEILTGTTTGEGLEAGQSVLSNLSVYSRLTGSSVSTSQTGYIITRYSIVRDILRYSIIRYILLTKDMI